MVGTEFTTRAVPAALGAGHRRGSLRAFRSRGAGSPRVLRGGGFRLRYVATCQQLGIPEVRRAEGARRVPALRETREGSLALDVALTVDVKDGDDWESMTVVPREAEATVG